MQDTQLTPGGSTGFKPITTSGFLYNAGLAWNASSKPVLKQVAETPAERIPLLTTGLSLRLNLLGAMVIEAYYACPAALIVR